MKTLTLKSLICALSLLLSFNAQAKEAFDLTQALNRAVIDASADEREAVQQSQKHLQRKRAVIQGRQRRSLEDNGGVLEVVVMHKSEAR